MFCKVLGNALIRGYELVNPLQIPLTNICLLLCYAALTGDPGIEGGKYTLLCLEGA